MAASEAHALAAVEAVEAAEADEATARAEPAAHSAADKLRKKGLMERDVQLKC